MANAVPEDPEQEYARVLTIAKEALKYIGVFRTPPTPGIYDVWYRYVEGSDTALHEQLSHAVTVSKSVSKEQLEYFHQQMIADQADGGFVEQVRDKLMHEIGSLTSLINTQLDANQEFDESVRAAEQSLEELIPTPAMIRGCVEQLVKSNRKMSAELNQLQVRMQESQSQIGELKENLIESQRAVLTDPLTGVGNRRYYDSIIKHAVARRGDRSELLYMLLVDLDRLKAINEAYGEFVGDDVIKHTAAVIQKMFPNATVARYAGDKFVVLLEVQDYIEVTDAANRLCKHFSGKEFQSNRIGERLSQVTISIGAAQLRSNDDKQTWHERAEKLLADAKRSGGNQAMVERNLRQD